VEKLHQGMNKFLKLYLKTEQKSIKLPRMLEFFAYIGEAMSRFATACLLSCCW